MKGFAVAISVLALATPVSAQDKITIKRAEYGTGYGPTCSATEAVQKLCDGVQSCELKVSNDLCGDPAKDEAKVKVLVTTYRCGDTSVKTDTTKEGGVAKLSCE